MEATARNTMVLADCITEHCRTFLLQPRDNARRIESVFVGPSALALLTGCAEMLMDATDIMMQDDDAVANAVERHGGYRKAYLRSDEGLYQFCRYDPLRSGIAVEDALRRTTEWIAARPNQRLKIEAPRSLGGAQQIATTGAIWSNSNRTKARTPIRVRNATLVRCASGNCNVKSVSGTRTS
jgi:hypothetical protein